MTTRLSAAGTHRRGNTLVLVAAVLVLLVIIATAYLSRTQSQRVVSVAQQSAQMRDDNADLIAEYIADEIAQNLFAWPVSTDDPALYDNVGNRVFPADSVFPRRQPPANARRYGVDPEFPYNRAPYHTVPFTNWPTPETVAQRLGADIDFVARFLPAGPGNPYTNAGDANGNSFLGALLASEGNPMGNPGFGDARWLADNEPVRWFTLDDNFEIPAFSHWRKMTNLSRPNNAWRVVADISDVDRFTVPDLLIPVEQWLAGLPWEADVGGVMGRPNSQAQMPVTGDTNLQAIGIERFRRQWLHWFGFDVTQPPGEESFVGIGNYLDAYLVDDFSSDFAMPSNFLRLSNLRGIGDPHVWQIDDIYQDRPESEFIRGTARNVVSRTLADASGDGYTDSFWFTAPTPVRDGIRQVVAVRIVDNSAKLNANVATRFVPNDDFFPPDDITWKTRGHTPSDLALVGGLATGPTVFNFNNIPGDQWNVGFYDNLVNWLHPDGSLFVNQQYRNTAEGVTPGDLWWRHLNEIGMRNDPDDPFEPAAVDRLDYWQRSARFGVDEYAAYPFPAARQYTPFTLADELELRMFHGNNYPWVLSRYELTTQPMYATGPGFLRAAMDQSEASEYLAQRTNRSLLADNRRKLTLHSGARNDLLPPELWWENRHPETLPPRVDILDPDANMLSMAAQQWRQKLDLREPEVYDGLPLGALTPPYYRVLTPTWDFGSGSYFNSNQVGLLNFRDRLPYVLLMALTDGPENLQIIAEESGLMGIGDFDSWLEWGAVYSSYFGPYTPDDLKVSDSTFNLTRRLAAAYAANILAYRSEDPVTINDVVLLPRFDGAAGSEDPLLTDFVIQEGRRRAGVPSIDRTYGYLGLDLQPFLVEALIGHVHVATLAEEDYPPTIFAGDYVFCKGRNASIVAVQIANPFPVPIELDEYYLRIYGQEVRLADESLEPAYRVLQPNEARVYYSIPGAFDPYLPPGAGDDEDPEDGVELDVDVWLEALQLGGLLPPGEDEFAVMSIVSFSEIGATIAQTRNFYDCSDATEDGKGGDNGVDCDARTGAAVELFRFMPAEPALPDQVPLDEEKVVVDRLDRIADNEKEFGDSVKALGDAPWFAVLTEFCEPTVPGFIWPGANPSNPAARFAFQWVHAKRAWETDMEGTGMLRPNERNPRYVFALHEFGTEESPALFAPGADIAVDGPIDGDMPPARFNSRDKEYDADGRLFFPMRMLLKKSEFEQVGELLNVFLFGHEIEFEDGFYTRTMRTFSEHMTDPIFSGMFNRTEAVDAGNGEDEVIENCWEKVMTGDLASLSDACLEWLREGEAFRVNRLRTSPRRFTIAGEDEDGSTAGGVIEQEVVLGEIMNRVPLPQIGLNDPDGPERWRRYREDPRHGYPAVPAGARVLDAFVCEGPGRFVFDLDESGSVDQLDVELLSFYNANEFSGRITPGLINVNTAMPEVFRALPHMTRIINEDLDLLNVNPFSRFITQYTWSLQRYRDRTGWPTWAFGSDFGPAYAHRGRNVVDDADLPFFVPGDEIRGFVPGMRSERGIASIGELMLMNQPGRSGKGEDLPGQFLYTGDEAVDNIDANAAWQIGYPGMPDRLQYLLDIPLTAPDAFPHAYLFEDHVDWAGDAPAGARISTNVYDVQPEVWNIAEDVAEHNLLFSGISNMVSTRSDVFTVYFRVRSFRQNPVTGVWDASDPEYIVDDTRYVMLVDRSNVNLPGEKPRILFLERLPK